MVDTKIEHTNKEIEKLDYLDALRGIAILGVLMIHIVGPGTLLPLGLQNLVSMGRFGVTLFFIVSAYTLYRSWDMRKEGNTTLKYFIRRFFRIAPAYYLVLFVIFIIIGKTVGTYSNESSVSLANLITHLTFTNGLFPNYYNSMIGVEWTIFTEVSFYAILPLLLYFITKNNFSIKFYGIWYMVYGIWYGRIYVI